MKQKILSKIKENGLVAVVRGTDECCRNFRKNNRRWNKNY